MLRSLSRQVGLMILLFLGWHLPLQVGTSVDLLPSHPTPNATVPLTSQNLFKFWNFDGQPAGEIPTGFSASTVGNGQPGVWKIEQEHNTPSSPNDLTQTAACPGEECFQFLLADGLTYDYFDVAVRIRAGGESPGGAGLVFAMKDQRNFYATVANFGSNTVEVLRMVEGKAMQLGRAAIQPWKMPWHLLRVRRNTLMSKDYIEVFFDSAQVMSFEEKTLGVGQIGLLTRGESVIAFDNLNAVPLYSQKPLSLPPAY